MTTARGWRTARDVQGPFPIRREDLPALNEVFSESFSDRYRRDGMVGVRVPHLNQLVWRYAIDDAAGGAMLWRDERDAIAGFNIAHMSGVEGWMGPLAVRPDMQGIGLGKLVVMAGVEWLREQGAKVIGLETMPRTMDNIGFYSSLGFDPQRLTITLVVAALGQQRPARLLGRLTPAKRHEAMAAIADLTTRVQPGYDFCREIELTDNLSLGDTVLLEKEGRLAGFALCHSVPLVEGRPRDELRVLKLVLENEEDMLDMMVAVADFARRSGTRAASVRVQGEYPRAYRQLIEGGARVRWTDLRMTLAGSPEIPPATGVVLSNWEI